MRIAPKNYLYQLFPIKTYNTIQYYNCIVLYYQNIWAVTCDFQQCGILTSVDPDKPVQPPSSLETPNYVQSVA